MIDQLLNDAAAKVRLVIFDVDGVLTDGRLMFGENGEALKVFNTLDGHGIKMLGQAGIKTAIISGRRSAFVEKRAADLEMDFLYQGREDKINALNELLAEEKFEMQEIAYLGDDLPDLPVIRRVGLGCAVANAHPFVREHAHGVTSNSGGQGAAREFCDFILAAQGRLDEMLAAYL
ncbi:MAG: KdsC family phosphatase [Endozoicomonas sp.]